MTGWPVRILHIDDDPVILDIMQAIFKRSGMAGTLISHSDAVTAQARIEEEKPALVLMDINMPGLDTAGMLGRLHIASRQKPLRIIYVTGYDIPDRHVKCDNPDIEILGHIQKPLAPARTIDEINNLWQNTNST